MNIPSSLPSLLVTGARGNLASAVVPDLRKSWRLRLTDLEVGGEAEEYNAADICRFGEVMPLMNGMEAVVHFAAATGASREDDVPLDGIDPADAALLRVNVNGTYNVFEAARRAGVRKIVYVSSLTGHLGDKHRVRYDDTTPFDPTNLYACTKIFGDNLGQLYARKYGISVICLRLGQPYPLLERLDDVWRRSKRARSWFVTMEDIRQAVVSALKSEVLFGTYFIVSASDNPRFDFSKAQEIGYVPRGYFSDAGLAFYENGCWPVFNGPVVTHDERTLVPAV